MSRQSGHRFADKDMRQTITPGARPDSNGTGRALMSIASTKTTGRIMMRGALIKAAAVLGLLCLTAASAHAQSWPQRPIKLICPFPAGGGTDLIARLVAKHLGDRLGQQVYVENRGGANGSLGAQALMQSEPDGYTIATISDGPTVANPA